MKMHVLRSALVALLAVVIGAAPITAAQADPGATTGLARESSVASAAATGLWHCSPFGGDTIYACTTIKNAPATGIKVLDRDTATIYTFYDGYSVALEQWYKDKDGKCAVNGNPYVWQVSWYNNGVHSGYLGDYYLNTGTVSNWSSYTDSWGTLGNDLHNGGVGTGTCVDFPYGN
ncbi:hypothetical protein [Micromonospora sp. NPDC023737]|uniref:hypothetical protein n=1 Tax=unclassified Micromonospora TaxID=2617518 RepID=UPI0033E36400